MTKQNPIASLSFAPLRGDKQRFDCLPPSIHPDTGEPFKWIVQPQVDWPEPPKWLLAIWTAWDKFKPQLQAACPWAEQPAPRKQEKPKQRQSDSVDVIGAFNDAHDLPTMLERYGYKRKGRTRYLSPTAAPGCPVLLCSLMARAAGCTMPVTRCAVRKADTLCHVLTFLSL